MEEIFVWYVLNMIDADGLNCEQQPVYSTICMIISCIKFSSSRTCNARVIANQLTIGPHVHCIYNLNLIKAYCMVALLVLR